MLAVTNQDKTKIESGITHIAGLDILDLENREPMGGSPVIIDKI